MTPEALAALEMGESYQPGPGGVAAAPSRGAAFVFEPHTVTVDGIELIVPRQYEVWADGVFERDLTALFADKPPIPSLNVKVEELHPQHASRLKRIVWRPTFVTAYGTRIDDASMLQRLAYLGPHEWTTRWVPVELVISRHKIEQLANFGVPVNCVSAVGLIQYLTACTEVNLGVLPSMYVGPRYGWNEFRDARGYSLPGTWIGSEQGIVTRETNPHTAALTPNGDLEAWKSFTLEWMMKHPIIRWSMGVSFAAPLLRVVNIRSFIVHHWCPTKGGKTAIARLAQSIWGHAKKFSDTLNRTEVSTIVPLARELSDLPILFNELETDSHEAFHRVIYALTEEQDRGRATKEGDGQKRGDSWRTVIRFTGESPVVGKSMADKGGQRTRVLEVEHNGISETEAKALHAWMENEAHYGHAGVEFLKTLDRIRKTPEGRDGFKMRFEQFRTRIRDTTTLPDSTVDQLAVIAYGEYLGLRWIWGLDKDVAEELVLQDTAMVVMTLTSMKDADSAATMAERVARTILSHRQAYPQQYADLTTETGQKRFKDGAQAGQPVYAIEDVTDAGRELWFNTELFDKRMTEEYKTGALTVKRALASAGAFIRQDSDRYASYRERFGRSNRYFILSMTELERLAGHERPTAMTDALTEPLEVDTAGLADYEP